MKLRPLLALALLAGCTNSCGSAEPPTFTGPPGSPPAAGGVSYEVHEWGLVRGTVADDVSISGPHADPVPMPVAKPVLYFHRQGEGPLAVDVTVTIPRGAIIEHWPLGEVVGSTLTWNGYGIVPGSCHGTRYPEADEPPCRGRMDGCEASELAHVETPDGDCVRAPDGASWDHLFYRGEVRGAPALPLRIEPLADGRVRVTNVGTTTIPGQLVRLRRTNFGQAIAAVGVAPPVPGSSVVIDTPSGSLQAAATALFESLRAAGLTEQEARAFGRAWDTTLFGPTVTASGESTTTAPVAASPMPAPFEVTSLLYLLPTSSADGLATLRFDPPPRAIRRAIVAWIDEARAPTP